MIYPEIFIVTELVKLPTDELSSLYCALTEDLRRVQDAMDYQTTHKEAVEMNE